MKECIHILQACGRQCYVHVSSPSFTLLATFFQHFSNYKYNSTEKNALLNFRPLSPLFSGRNDILFLTLSVFLIGGPLTNFPWVDFRATLSNRMIAWAQGQQLMQHYWNCWYKKYFN